jgi:N6-adenosine-specific RNA methylase IME4
MTPAARQEVSTARDRGDARLLEGSRNGGIGLGGPGTGLERLCRVEQMLATIDRADEALHLANMAEAARVWALREHQATPVVNYATSIKARALKRMAECVDEGQARGEIATKGGDGSNQYRANVTSPDISTPATLTDLGITRQRLHEARKLAVLQDGEIAETIASASSDGQVVGLSDLVRLAQKDSDAEKKADAIRSIEALDPATGEFAVIVIDPPWPYTSRTTDVTHQARLPYPSMSLEELAELPIPAGPDCALWLWTTTAFMHEAYHLIEHWGFKPKTILTWAKDRKGTGDWLRGQTEHCILALKGHPPATHTSQSTLLRAPRREHSRKPDEFFTLVESLCPGPKLEMFARQRRERWKAHGAEPDRFQSRT